jgi:hypothetical protein
MPFTTPSVSSIAFKIGVIAFVVQDAAENIYFIRIVFVLVYTVNNIWYSFTGAVNKTLSTPTETK